MLDFCDDTSSIITEKYTNYVINQFNNFDKELKVTIDTFESCVPNFPNIEIYPNGLGIYHKHTNNW